MVPGFPETFIPTGNSVTIFGQLQNKRWRCAVQNNNHLDGKIKKNLDKTSQEFCTKNEDEFNCCFPLIGSIPSSIIVELNQDISNEKISEQLNKEIEKTKKEMECTKTDIEPTKPTLCECGRNLSKKNSFPRRRFCSFCQYCQTPGPIQTITSEHLEYQNFQSFPTPGRLPTLPESPTESTIAELNKALKNLTEIAPRSRPVSGGSDSSCNSWKGRT